MMVVVPSLAMERNTLGSNTPPAAAAGFFWIGKSVSPSTNPPVPAAPIRKCRRLMFDNLILPVTPFRRFRRLMFIMVFMTSPPLLS